MIIEWDDDRKDRLSEQVATRFKELGYNVSCFPASDQPLSENGTRVSYSDSEISIDGGDVAVRGKRVELTLPEYWLLVTLIGDRGSVTQYKPLHDRLGISHPGLKTLVRRMRGKIERSPRSPILIRTFRSFGYYYSQPDAKSSDSLDISSPYNSPPPLPTYAVGPIAVTDEEICVDGRVVYFPSKQRDFLMALLKNTGREVSHRKLQHIIYGVGDDYDVDYKKRIRMLASRTREKIGDPEGRLIRSIRNIGYTISTKVS